MPRKAELAARREISGASHELNREMAVAYGLIHKKECFDALFDPQNYQAYRDLQELVRTAGEPEGALKELNTNLKQAAYQVSTLIAGGEYQHLELYSHKDSMNAWFLVQAERSTSKLVHTASRSIIVDVVQDETPCYCKVYVGDRHKPTVKFFIEEASAKTLLF